MNNKQKIYVKEETIEIIESFDAMIINSLHPDGEDRSFYIGDKHTGYLTPVWNYDGKFLECINLVNTNYVISAIPMRCCIRSYSQ